MLLACLLLAVLTLAYANGANDNFKATATLFGSGTHGYRAALGLATAAQIAGSLASVFLAGLLLKAFSGKGLVPGSVVTDPHFLVAVATGGAGAVLLATRLGIPISTTHALIGALVGAGAIFAPGELQWSALGTRYFLPLLLSPLLALVGAALLYPLARVLGRALGIRATTCVCIGERLEPVVVGLDGALLLKRTGAAVTLGESEACETSYVGRFAGISAERLCDHLHRLSACALGFARGLNDTPKVLALLVAAGWSGMPPALALAIVAVVMAIGGLLHSRRIAETLGHRITSMNRAQGLVANGVSSALVIGASLMGSPVSTTHVSTGAIFGIGTQTGRADWRVVSGIVAAWVATLPLAALLAVGCALLTRHL